ncbi:MAG TPA: thioredoxin-like domain-containing protein [Flavobacteriales bacterium]|nr:thioredoxin-like domain-containing protein [Flavobacteriales bacterium]
MDSFELKLRKFYAEVKDPWFDHYFTYSMAGMRYGPRVNDEGLFNTYLKGKPVRYDNPEYVRFIRSFYAEHLLMAKRFSEERLQRAYEAGKSDSLKAILRSNEFLKGDDRLCEVVMIDLLYQQYHSKHVVREGADAILAEVAAASAFPEHRSIATNMLWDLTTMRVGSRLPPMRLVDVRGDAAIIDSVLRGPVCLAFTASWCSYCDLELQGLEQLLHEYKDAVNIIVIDLDADPTAMKNYMKSHPGMDFTWLRAEAEQQLREDLRIRSLPVFYLLNDDVLARSPAPPPSNGLGAFFQQAKVEAEKGTRVKVWDE